MIPAGSLQNIAASMAPQQGPNFANEWLKNKYSAIVNALSDFARDPIAWRQHGGLSQYNIPLLGDGSGKPFWTKVQENTALADKAPDLQSEFNILLQNPMLFAASEGGIEGNDIAPWLTSRIAKTAAERTAESDAAIANIVSAGGRARDVPSGHMITPDGRGIEPFVKNRGVTNHYEVAIDAGYLPAERLDPGTLTGDSTQIVNGMLQRGWIRNTGSYDMPSYQVFSIPEVKNNLENTLSFHPSTTAKFAYIDEVATGKSYRIPFDVLRQNNFNLSKSLRQAEVYEGTPVQQGDIELLGSPTVQK